MQLLESLNRFVWGVPALLGVVGVGIYLSVQTKFCQVRLLPGALRMFFRQLCTRKQPGRATTPYRALCTALAATVGTGNLAGVAGAIAIGGPGAVFWMWICAILGMVTKFAEATLAVYKRHKNQTGEWVGGPMYMMQDHFQGGLEKLAYVYSFFGVIAAFGVGNTTQINALIGGIDQIVNAYQLPVFDSLHLIVGAALAVVIGLVLLGGAKRIGELAERLVPFAAVLYILLAFVLLILQVVNMHRVNGQCILLVYLISWSLPQQVIMLGKYKKVLVVAAGILLTLLLRFLLASSSACR
jgi:AGCS family alanine or glycine:cation symporter